MRQQLIDLRQKLLHLHQVLLETERVAYEQIRGRVSSGELLQLMIHHAQFAWLQPLSTLIVQIDEQLSAAEPATPDDLRRMLTEARTLLTPSEMGHGFVRKYYLALQHEPAAVLAHAEVTRILSTEQTKI